MMRAGSRPRPHADREHQKLNYTGELQNNDLPHNDGRYHLTVMACRRRPNRGLVPDGHHGIVNYFVPATRWRRRRSSSG
jgi:hypothetical protein